jgi:hypothetical protein
MIAATKNVYWSAVFLAPLVIKHTNWHYLVLVLAAQYV